MSGMVTLYLKQLRSNKLVFHFTLIESPILCQISSTLFPCQIDTYMTLLSRLDKTCYSVLKEVSFLLRVQEQVFLGPRSRASLIVIKSEADT